MARVNYSYCYTRVDSWEAVFIYIIQRVKTSLVSGSVSSMGIDRRWILYRPVYHAAGLSLYMARAAGGKH
jgi:hypothetical protein